MTNCKVAAVPHERVQSIGGGTLTIQAITERRFAFNWKVRDGKKYYSFNGEHWHEDMSVALRTGHTRNANPIPDGFTVVSVEEWEGIFGR